MLHSPSQTHDLEESGGSQPNDNHVSTHHHPLRLGYKIVIDNIDKAVKPRYMRIDSQKKSLHYVQIYNVKDRIDFSSLSESAKAGEVSVRYIFKHCRLPRIEREFLHSPGSCNDRQPFFLL